MRTGRAAATALACVALTAASGGCAGDEETGATVPAQEELAPEAPGGAVTEPAEPGPPDDDEESEAAAAAEAHVAAIDSRDPVAACALLAPGALDGVRGAGGDCETDLDRLIGRPPKGGAPAWDGTRVVNLISVVTDADRARVTLEVFHRFADRKNPSVEDDVIFLELRDGRWLVSQPDATLYRAVGYPEPPLSAFTPPAG